jgi:hypothetical protein
LIADAFHVLFDLLSFSLALGAIVVGFLEQYACRATLKVNLDFRKGPFELQKFVIWLATGTAPRILFQWRIPTGFGI